MAVVSTNKKPEELNQQQQAQQQAAQQQTAQQQIQQPQTVQTNPYTGLKGVNTNTAQQLGNYQQGYQQSDAVLNAQQQLQQIENLKPQGYNSKYGAQLDEILNRIQNPQQFKYSFNGDELFKNYADVYTQKGRQAALDVQGQAAGLTGGYGNSYGQMVSQQQYQQYIMDLYNKGIDLYDRAYQKYRDDQQSQLNQYNVLAQQDQNDYGRYRDDVGDWMNERGFWADRYDTETDRDYGRYENERNYWSSLAQQENADYRTEQQFNESVRQYNESLAEQKRQWDMEYNYNKMSEERKYAYNTATNILASGKMPSDAILRQAGLSKEDAQKMMAQVQAVGSRGGSPKGPTYYQTNDGSLWKLNGDGMPTKVTLDEIPNNARIEDGDKAHNTVVSAVGTNLGRTGMQGVIQGTENIVNALKKKN